MLGERKDTQVGGRLSVRSGFSSRKLSSSIGRVCGGGRTKRVATGKVNLFLSSSQNNFNDSSVFVQLELSHSVIQILVSTLCCKPLF